MAISNGLNIFRSLNSVISRNNDSWSEIDKVSLMGKLMIYEAATHWLWLIFVAFNFSQFDNFVSFFYLFVLLFGCTLFIITIWILIRQIKSIKNQLLKFKHHQVTMLIAYLTYVTGFLLLIGQDSIVTGVFLSSALIGLVLADRNIIWRLFVFQCFVVVSLSLLPYWIGEFPSLRLTTDDDPEVMVQSHFFWRLSYLYMGLPKAIVIVFTMRRLLDGIEYRKKLIRYRADFDELTKIRNRRGMFDVARQVMSQQISSRDTSVILIDLDHFKQINDVYGHLAGDKALYHVAQLFKKHLPSSGILGRYGGEEFLAILPNTDSEVAVNIAHNLRLKLCNQLIDIGGGQNISMTSSFGVASLHVDCVDFIYHVNQRIDNNRQYQRKFNLELDEIIKVIIDQADQALYQAKSQGRNRVMVSPVVYFDKLKHIGSFSEEGLAKPLREDADMEIPLNDL